MDLIVFFENCFVAKLIPASASYSELKAVVSNLTKVPENHLYATQNGRLITGTISGSQPVRFFVRLFGGKGGFGSMLRAIGAQIEKTTNREACRDLSGRRLRDIREERRLREWAANNPQRTEDAARRKEDRLKRLCAVPSHEFQDPAYEEARRRLEEDGGASLEAGLGAAPLPAAPPHSANKKRKPNLWIDEDMSDLSSSESGCEDNGSPASGSSEEPEISPSSAGKGKGRGKRSYVEALGVPPPGSCTATAAKIAAGNDSGNESDIKPV